MEFGDEALVLGGGAYGYADPGGQLIGGHGADDDAFGHEGVEDFIAVADVDEDEIGVAGDVFEAHFGELLLEIGAARVGEFAGFALVIEVLEASDGAGLGDGVGVEGLAGFLQDADDAFCSEAVADAEAGEALDF